MSFPGTEPACCRDRPFRRGMCSPHYRNWLDDNDGHRTHARNPRALRLTAKALAALDAPSALGTRQRLLNFGFTAAQADALVSAGYGFTGMAPRGRA